MDATSDKLNKGNIRHRCAAVALVALFSCAFAEGARAQSARLKARKSPSPITHNLNDEPQTFEPVRWDIRSPFPNGCLIEWEAQSFTHESEPAAKANCEMFVRLTQSAPPSARWTVANPRDSTSWESGKDTATVSVTSSGSGRAQVQLTLSFHNASVTNLAAGKYETTVVGTITGL